jgi:hypothetical protein
MGNEAEDGGSKAGVGDLNGLGLKGEIKRHTTYAPSGPFAPSLKNSINNISSSNMNEKGSKIRGQYHGMGFNCLPTARHTRVHNSQVGAKGDEQQPHPQQFSQHKDAYPLPCTGPLRTDFEMAPLDVRFIDCEKWRRETFEMAPSFQLRRRRAAAGRSTATPFFQKNSARH